MHITSARKRTDATVRVLRVSCHQVSQGLILDSEDTPEAFACFDKLYDISQTASVPVGYELVVQGLNASIQGRAYVGFALLPAYDPAVCADFCSAEQSCNAFNLCAFISESQSDKL